MKFRIQTTCIPALRPLSSTLLLALSLGLLASCAVPMHAAQPTPARAVVAPETPQQAGNCRVSAEVTGDVRLEPGCVYHQQLRISTNGTQLDCQGAWLDGGGTLANGIVIDSNGQPLTDVTVQNCNIRAFATGVRVGWAKADEADEAEGGSVNAAANAPRKITLSHLTVVDSTRVGISIDRHAHHITVRDSTIEGSGGVGMYLEYGSSDNRVMHNKFVRNGRVMKREGLAIDSSRNNVVTDNLFQDNEHGGIFLYKNCGASVATGRSVSHTQHSDHNLIHRNTFSGEKIGVWIASRQSVDLKRLDCADAPMDAGGHYYEDFANANSVTGNQFCATQVGIRVEGDANILTGNSYDRRTGPLISVPVSQRAVLLGRPSTGNLIDAGRLNGEACS